MDAIHALVLTAALLIIAAVLLCKAIKFISPSLHASHPVAVDRSDKDSVPISTPPSIDFAKYDVFLSFRGDTRDGFTSHLFEALSKAKIQTFIDNELEKGEEISPVLMKTIKESEIYVIIFSKDYASSTWCLEELVKILECKQKYGRIVIPIFYNIDPSTIRKQSGSYGDAFIKHEQRFMNNKHKVQRWKDALTQAANLSGWDSENIRPEAKLVKEIVKDVLSKLKGMSSCHFEGLVGIRHCVKEIEALLANFRTVGIWGMGGIGKTTLAKVVFHKLKAQFESCLFVDVREELARIGLDQLLKKCLSKLLKDKNIDTSDFVKKRLESTKILLVLDDVNNFIQVKDLIKLCDWFGQGSKTIITSRDMQVLKNSTPYDGAYETYHVQKMDFDDALQLFSLRAFKHNEPAKNYVELSKCVVDYCQGNPLALTVLGCFLYGRRKEEWESALEDLKQAPNDDIFNVLRLSFDGLNDRQKNIFLDLACFFRERNELHEESIQNYYDFSVKIVISVLKDRSLISVDKKGKITMHDLVEAMGQKIACQEYNEAGKLIHLWKHEDIYHFLRNKKGSKTIRGISLDMGKIKKIFLKADAFQNMYNLRFLDFYKYDPDEPSKVSICGVLDTLPEELRILRWTDYPQPCVPLGFCATNLVKLEMSDSHLQQLWNGDQHFPNLKTIDLWCSQLLMELPNLSQAPNIEELMLVGCKNLHQINSSIPLAKLRVLVLDCCDGVRSAEILTVCDQLELLFWYYCPLQSLPLTSYCWRKVVHLSFSESKLEQLWDEPQHFPHLQIIRLKGSKYLIRMPDLSQAPNIQCLDLEGCSSLLQLYSSTVLFNLERVYLYGCSELMKVNLCWEQRPLQCLPWISCQQLHNNLECLSMAYSKVEKLWDGNQHFPRLTEISLRGCKHLIELPDLSQTPNIRTLDIAGCVNLVQIHSSSIPVNLECLDFSGCHKLRRVDLGSNVHRGGLKTLVTGCIYFDLKKLTFTKVTISFTLSDNGRIYRIGFKAESVPFTEFVNGNESGELKLLRQSLSTLLPFVRKLRCLNIPSSIESRSSSYPYLLNQQHRNNLVLSLILYRNRIRAAEWFEFEGSLRQRGMKGKRTREVGWVLEHENSTQLDCDCICESISKVPNTITRWSLLTELSLQESDIVRVHGNGSIPGPSCLKSLAESHCSSLPPVIDLTFSMTEFPSFFNIQFSQDLNQSDSYVTQIGNFHVGCFTLVIVKTD